MIATRRNSPLATKGQCSTNLWPSKGCNYTTPVNAHPTEFLTVSAFCFRSAFDRFQLLVAQWFLLRFFSLSPNRSALLLLSFPVAEAFLLCLKFPSSQINKNVKQYFPANCNGLFLLGLSCSKLVFHDDMTVRYDGMTTLTVFFGKV